MFCPCVTQTDLGTLTPVRALPRACTCLFWRLSLQGGVFSGFFLCHEFGVEKVTGHLCEHKAVEVIARPNVLGREEGLPGSSRLDFWVQKDSIDDIEFAVLVVRFLRFTEEEISSGSSVTNQYVDQFADFGHSL